MMIPVVVAHHDLRQRKDTENNRIAAANHVNNLRKVQFDEAADPFSSYLCLPLADHSSRQSTAVSIERDNSEE